MKRFLIMLLCLLLTFPFLAASAPSPTVKDMIWCEPEMLFEVLDTVDFDLKIEGYTLIEALKVTVEEPMTQVTWYIMAEITENDSIKTAIIDNDLIIHDAEITEDGGIIVDFTDIEPNTYFLYFFKGNT